MRPRFSSAARGTFVIGLLLSCASGCEARKAPLRAPPDPEPVTFVTSTDVRRVAVGWNDICVLMADGTVRCKQDYRPSGERRLGSFLAISGATKAVDIASGHHHACARLESGAVACWGRNDSGEVSGDEPLVRIARVVPLPAPAAEIRVGDTQSCARLASGAVFCWGLVAGSAHAPPTELTWFANAAGLALSVDALCAFSATGLLQCSFGGGLRVEPVGEAHVTRVTLGRYRGCAAIDDGTVRCFALSLPKGAPVTGKPAPWAEPVAGLSDVVELAAGTSHVCARKKDGTVWCWGDNQYGQLGNGTRAASAEPTLVKKLTDASELFAGGDRSCARRGDGIVCWGADLLGDAFYRALTGLSSDPGPPGPNDSLVPETLRVPVFTGTPAGAH